MMKYTFERHATKVTNVIIGIVPFNLFKYGVTTAIVYFSLDRLRAIFLRREYFIAMIASIDIP
jgi:hypothetical protein